MSRKTLQVISPYDRSIVAEIDMNTADEAELALQTAYDLFIDRSRWLPAHRRIAILEKSAAIMEQRVDELTRTAAQEGGKPWVDSKVEVMRAINGVKLAAQEAGRIAGEQIPMGSTAASENRLAFTTREPIGVVMSISAFNHPLNLIVHQTATAFAAGCPVVVKPASTTPMSCLGLVAIYREAGMPEGWVQPIICDNETAEKLATDKRVNYLSFIGSERVGWHLKSKLAPGTRCALEHGGAAPVIVESDADLADMIPLLAKGGFYHAGQVCVSVQRVFVHESIARTVAEAVAAQAAKLKVGDPLDPETEVGPLILPKEVDRIEEWVAAARLAGADILTGGHRLSDTTYAPTVLWNPPGDADVSSKEIFGPVVCIYPYSDRNEAIRRANQLDYHFQAAVFTKHLDVAFDTVSKLNATAVMVNDHTAFRVDWMPFGGRDASGEGLGGIPYSVHEMTRTKLMVLRGLKIGD
jgi:acyl-CoA reductase-like NAD-dependent aldehyde dehydrogenase